MELAYFMRPMQTYSNTIYVQDSTEAKAKALKPVPTVKRQDHVNVPATPISKNEARWHERT